LGSIDTNGKTIIITLFADCVSLRLKGTRKENAYQLPIPHLMDELCRREARRAMIEKLKNQYPLDTLPDEKRLSGSPTALDIFSTLDCS
jgi:hypothetical protein